MKFWLIWVGVLLVSCTSEEEIQKMKLSGFVLLDDQKTNISFSNDLTYTERFNTYTYRNFYNGAGVALGDINNDGLLDLYICGNLVNNKLYLNQGNFKFKDITSLAGVGADDSWSTGVSMADVNGDGLLDLYICKSGPPQLLKEGVKNNRHNQLFINNGDLTFTDRAGEYGVADEGLSTHAAFLDFDKDGDLDMYLLNNSTRPIGAFDLKKGRREERDPDGANKLYRNDGRTFTDVSESAGIYGSAIGYGLGVTVGDVNKDGWQDLFISNDFFERDYLYVNQRDGTFKELLPESMPEISLGSMGADMADLNNDGWPEIYVTEMLPASLERVKTKTLFESWDKYQTNLKNGYHHQFTRNSLQLNRGADENGIPYFTEISRIKGMEATDWSWGALIFDFNNDQHKDVFVANGVYKDLTDHDYASFYANNDLFISKYTKDTTVLTNLIDKIPSTPVQNYLFVNDGKFNFKNKSTELGFSAKGFSNGAAYGDLDNDGDLDLVINNINAPLSVFQNNSSDGHSIQFQLKGAALNTAAFGTQISVYVAGNTLYQEQAPVKGYLSSVDPRVHFGLGSSTLVDSVKILWTDNTMSTLYELVADSIYLLEESKLKKEGRLSESKGGAKPLLQALDNEEYFEYAHQENKFIDFNSNRLAFEMISAEGPHSEIGDFNNDGLSDIYVGGAKGIAPTLLKQKEDGSFVKTNERFWKNEAGYEDSDALFIDIENDGDLDLFVTSGSIENRSQSVLAIDRLYLNNGKGGFTKKELPVLQKVKGSTAFVKTLDFDNDGDSDLIIGQRVITSQFGLPGNLSLLENDGNGNFTDVSNKYSDDFNAVGMMKDAAITDLEGDGDLDIVIVGEWMPVTFMVFENGKFTKEVVPGSSGFWNTVLCSDFNGDGSVDIMAGNHGLNTRFHASINKPLTMYVNDFDQNGAVEQIITQYEGEKAYPINMLQDLVKQMPHLRKVFPKYEDFKDQTIVQMFDSTILNRSVVKKIDRLETSILFNAKNRKFVFGELPEEVQYAPVHAIAQYDVNRDGVLDLILGGNQLHAKPEWGVYNGFRGQVLSGKGDGKFTYLPNLETGLNITGEVRDIDVITIDQKEYLLFWRNNLEVKKYRVNEK